MKNVCRLSIYLLAVSFLFGINEAQTLTVRNAHSMVYDSVNSRTILFGGADEKQVFGDLWILKKDRWKLLKAKGPKPRTFASLVFDERKKSIILFGGNGVLFGNENNPARFFNDTWEYKKGSWRKIKTEKSPPPRSSAAIAYDRVNERIILFGGYSLEKGKNKRFGDTWVFKHGNWKKLGETGPSPRVGAEMAYDSHLGKVVLFGGSTEVSDYGEDSGETWVLSGDKWEKLKIKQPTNIFNSNMVYQADGKRLFRFAGWNGKGRINESWVFQKNKWKKLDFETKPAARNHSAMVYDSKRNRTILFGGHNGEEIFGDLWIFEDGKWYKHFEHLPIKRVNNGH